MTNPKNHTISKLVAKNLARLVIVLLALPLITKFTDKKLDSSAIHFENPWSIIFPFILFAIVLTLLILMLKNQYQKIDLNWLFSLSAGFFIMYLLLLYSRVYPLL